ncbi:MAG: peptide-methionine (S)-S-oxide reductase MsrA [Christensenella sp.]
MKHMTILLTVSVLAAATLFSACAAPHTAAAAGVKIDKDNLSEIYYAGGCFWGVEDFFSKIPGVYDVVSGYANGNTQNPTYEEVCAHNTGFAETVRVSYDANVISLEVLTAQFFKLVSPTAKNMPNDQYRSGIYYTESAQKDVIDAVLREVQERCESPVTTEVLPLLNFYEAEDYHQDYVEKSAGGACHVNNAALEDLKITEDGKVVDITRGID